MADDDLVRTVLAYVAAWNTEAEADRRELLERAFATDGIYVDPGARVLGRDALVVHSRRYAERLPGAGIALTSGIDVHDGRACFTWRATGPDGATIREGIDFVTAGADWSAVRGARLLRRLHQPAPPCVRRPFVRVG